MQTCVGARSVCVSVCCKKRKNGSREMSMLEAAPYALDDPTWQRKQRRERERKKEREREREKDAYVWGESTARRMLVHTHRTNKRGESESNHEGERMTTCL